MPRLLLLPAGSLMLPTLRLTPAPPLLSQDHTCPAGCPVGKVWALVLHFTQGSCPHGDEDAQQQQPQAVHTSSFYFKERERAQPARLMRATTQEKHSAGMGQGCPGGREEEAPKEDSQAQPGQRGPSPFSSQGRCPKCITPWGGISLVGILKGLLWPLHP